MSYAIDHDIPMAAAIPVTDVAPSLPHAASPIELTGQDSSGPKQQLEKNEGPERQKHHQQTVITATTTTITHHEPFNKDQLQGLEDQGFTRGLSNCLDQMKEAFALRIWIVDNSGSMQKSDGHRVVVPPKKPKDVRMVECTRWQEIKECLECHINLAGLIQAPTRFRLLNNPGVRVGRQHFSVAEDPTNPDRIANEVQEALSIMRNAQPSGCTPLTRHIQEIHQEVSAMAPELQRMGKKVAIIIATDGLPTDERGYDGYQQQQEFIHALRQLEGLPVWVVVRLCTDEEEVVNFYNNMDNQLELSLEVLDDFSGEALEVAGNNPWLNYALPLHRMREMGFHDRLLDLLDERRLNKSELRDFCALLFGQEDFDGVTDPAADWKGFMKDIDRLLRREAPQWNPVTKKVGSWMNTKKLNKAHRSSRRWF